MALQPFLPSSHLTHPVTSLYQLPQNYLPMNFLPILKPMLFREPKHSFIVLASMLIPPARAAEVVRRRDPLERGVGVAHDALPEVVPAVD